MMQNCLAQTLINTSTSLLLTLKRLTIFCLILAGPSNVLFSQGLFPKGGIPKGEMGFPQITNYFVENYNGEPENWAIAQDDQGLLYVANDAGILIFDGVDWQIYSTPGAGLSRTLTKDSNGKIWGGNVGDLGYYEYDSIGQISFQSMRHLIPEIYQNFENVWYAHAKGDTVLFVTNYSLFQYAPGMDSMKVYTTEGERFHVSALVNGQYFIREWGTGLKILEKDELRLLPGGERFAQTRIYSIIPYDDEGRLLICTREEGLFLYDGVKFSPFRSGADSYLFGENGIYHASSLPGGQFALATIGNGVIIIDKNGRLLYKLDLFNGLADNSAAYTFVDKANALWIATGNGISRVAINSPYTYFSDPENPIGVIYAIKRFKNRIYIGTSRGIAYLAPNTGRIIPLGNLTQEVFALEIIGDKLYCGGKEGLFSIENRQLKAERLSVNSDFSIASLLPSKADPNRLWIGLGSGLTSLYRMPDGSLNEEEYIVGSEGEVFNIVEGKQGDLWLGYVRTNMRRIQFPNWPSLERPTVRTYYESDGLSSGGKLVFDVNGDIFASKNGTYKWVENEDRFELTKNFEGKDILDVEENGSVWLANDRFSELAMALPEEDGTYSIKKDYLRPLADAIISSIYQERNGVAWISTGEGLVKYNPNKDNPEANAYSTLIRQIIIGPDSLIYAGNVTLPRPTIDFSLNTISFKFGAPSFHLTEKTVFQTWLEGYDKKWSSWTDQPYSTYANLQEGKYKLKVRARDINGTVGQQAVFQFSIPVPWYRQWWAYVFYIFAGLGLVYALILWRTVQLRKQQERLELLVEERTRELSTVNQVSRALSEQLEFSELIKLVGDQLRDLFEANIVYVALLDENTQMINFPYQHGDVIPPLPLGQGLTSNIIQNKKPILINREVDKRYEELGINQHGKLASSYLGVPIPSGNEVIGVLSVQSTEKVNRFDQNDQSLLRTLAAHVGIALHNAKLFEDTKQAKAAAEAANEAKSSFLSTVSHELRTPLTSILGFAKIIQKRLNERIIPVLKEEDLKVNRAVNQVKENLEIVISEGQRLTTLINDVLDLAKIEAGKVEWNMQKISVIEVVQQAKATTSALFHEKKLKYEENIHGDFPQILGDRDKLLQVMINLLSNAVKFTDKGTITTTAKMTDEGIQVSVKDTGIGIAQEDIHKVFDKFRQVGDTLTDKPKGTGLGLPICKEIIEKHGGRIWVESDPLGQSGESGSTFYFTIPLSQKQKEKSQQLQFAGLINQLKKQVPISTISSKARQDQTILVVDDEAPIRELLRQELSEIGYHIETAENGKKALEKIRDNKPDVIILDVMMPELNGFDLAAILKNDPKTMDIPILILSIIQDKERGFRIGVDRYLTKPVDTEMLFNEVEELLNQGISTKKVLVVDENTSTISTLTQVLSARGYQVAEAGSQDLLEKAKDILPDVIILNSVLDGREEIVKSLRFEKGLENVLFLLYQ